MPMIDYCFLLEEEGYWSRERSDVLSTSHYRDGHCLIVRSIVLALDPGLNQYRVEIHAIVTMHDHYILKPISD